MYELDNMNGREERHIPAKEAEGQHMKILNYHLGILNEMKAKSGSDERYMITTQKVDPRTGSPKDEDVIEIKLSGNESVILYASMIRRIYRDGSYIKVCLYDTEVTGPAETMIEGKCISEKTLFADTLNNIYSRYEGRTLVFINRSLIINEREGSYRNYGHLYLHSGEAVPIGKKYAKECRARFKTKDHLEKDSAFIN
jgi:hypothetical protein